MKLVMCSSTHSERLADISLYLVKLSAYKVGNSEPAPLFTIVVGPSAQAKEIGKEKQGIAKWHVFRLKFWSELLEKAKQMGFKLKQGKVCFNNGIPYRTSASYPILIE
jgi:hypothetical protein